VEYVADPEVTETIKRTTQPGIITRGHGSKTARTVAVRPGEPINAAAFTVILRQIIANNHAGG
jgi:hypothetical protein